MTIHVLQAKTDSQRKALFRFLYEIYSTEFFRSMDGMNHEYRFLQDELDQTAQHFIAVDESGQVLGCVRGNILDIAQLPENLKTHLQINRLVDLFPGNQICYASHFAVAPNARGKTVASLLIKALYRYYLEHKIDVGVSYCALHYISFYYQLGYRPYGDSFSIDAGTRVPIIHCVRDKQYLDEIRSPLARLCPQNYDDYGEASDKLQKHFSKFKNPGFSRTQRHHLWARLAHTALTSEQNRLNLLFADLTEGEREIACHRGTELTFSQGAYIYRRGEKEKGMGVLLSGSLGIEFPVGKRRRIVNVILPGEPFGEIYSLSNGYRTTDLVALEDSTALLFSADYLEQINRKNRDIGFKITNRLLKIVASRFANFSDMAVYAAQVAKINIDKNSKHSTNSPFHYDQ